MITIQYTVYPIGVDPELGVKFNITTADKLESQARAKEMADRIAIKHGWLDRGVAEWCIIDSPKG